MNVSMQDTLHHIPDEVLDAPPKQCSIPSWQPSSDMPSPAKRHRTDSGNHDEALLTALQAGSAKTSATNPCNATHDSLQEANDNSQLPGDSAQAQDKVLLEKGDCAAAAPVAA